MTLVVGFAPDKDDSSAIELAATLARSAGTDLQAVTVVPARWPTPTAARTDREFEQWAAERGERAVAEATALLAEHCPDLTTSASWIPGRSIPSALHDKAKELDADMLVVGSAQHGSWGHVVVSSSADWLLHSSEVPVALATRGYRAGTSDTVARATCAFRGDEVSQRTLARTAEICGRVGARLRVVTFAVRGRRMYPPEVSGAEDMVLEKWAEDSAKAQQAALEQLGDSGLDRSQIESLVAVASDWGHALDKVEWDSGDVLVIGSSSAGVVSRLFLGSTASKIVRQSPVPVIVVP